MHQVLWGFGLVLLVCFFFKYSSQYVNDTCPNLLMSNLKLMSRFAGQTSVCEGIPMINTTFHQEYFYEQQPHKSYYRLYAVYYLKFTFLIYPYVRFAEDYGRIKKLTKIPLKEKFFYIHQILLLAYVGHFSNNDLMLIKPLPAHSSHYRNFTGLKTCFKFDFLWYEF